MSDTKEKNQIAIEEDLVGDQETISSVGSYVDPFHHERKLKKALKARHLSVITIVNIFGTGLFLSSGSTLAKTGPVGIFLGYLIVGLVVGGSQMCIAEASCFCTATAGYVRHAELFVDPAFGFMMGWIDVYACIIPSELSAAAVVMKYWSNLSPAIWITIFGLIVVAVNSYNVQWYGEIEFVFGLLKLSLIIILIVTGLVIDLGGVPGQDRIGFRYWKNPGPFSPGPYRTVVGTGGVGKFTGFWAAISSIVYSYGGVQGCSLLAGESKNPRKSIYRASQSVFAITFTFYLATVFILTLIVPYNNTVIASPTGDASASPFVVAIGNSIQGLPHYINAIVCTSALSAANYAVMKASRVIFALAAKKQAPKIFLTVNKHGLPYVAVGFSCMFIPLAYMSVSETADTVFGWFQNITSSSILLSWVVISINHIRLMKGLKAQGYSRKDLPYTFPGAEYASWFSLFFSVIFLLTGGFGNFIHGFFEFGSFFAAYFIIPLGIILFVGFKLIFKTKFIKPEDMDLKNLFRDIELHPEPESTGKWYKLN